MCWDVNKAKWPISGLDFKVKNRIRNYRRSTPEINSRNGCKIRLLFST